MLFNESGASFDFKISVFNYDDQTKEKGRPKKYHSFHQKISYCRTAVDFIARNRTNFYLIEVKHIEKFKGKTKDELDKSLTAICRNIIDSYGAIKLIDREKIELFMVTEKYDQFIEISKNIDELQIKFILFITGSMEKDDNTLINDILNKKLNSYLSLFNIDILVETTEKHNKNLYDVCMHE